MSKQGKYPPPYSLRLTFEERQRLERDAGNIPLSAYIRERLFNDPSPRRRYSKRHKDHDIFLEILKELSDTRISSNLNQLAKASHMGKLVLAPETEEELKEACLALKDIRSEIMRNMGLKT